MGIKPRLDYRLLNALRKSAGYTTETTDLMVKVLNHTLKAMLSSWFVKDNQHDKDCHWPLLLMVYCSACTPSEMKIWRRLRLMVDLLYGRPESDENHSDATSQGPSKRVKHRR